MTRYERLADVLQRERASILVQAGQLLARCHLPHYTQDGPAEAARRLERLYSVVQQSLERRNAWPIVNYAENIARQRQAGGYRLRELQGAFNAFEEAVWDHLVTSVELEHVVEAIGLLSSVLGAGKDALASAYVAAATERQRPAPVEAAKLFRGTEGV